MFKITFTFLGKEYSAKVQKIISKTEPVSFVVFDIDPFLRTIPSRLIYVSDAQKDQLVYRSFHSSQARLLMLIGERIFVACHDNRISVHA